MMRSRNSRSVLGVLTLAGPSACLIEPTPGFGATDTGTTTATPGSTTADATTFDDGMTSNVDTGESSSTGDDPIPLPLPPRGYQPRPCGFDFDHDGIVGEPGGIDQIDECSICNGVETDPDGDGFEQPMLYVDCDAGVDPEPSTADDCEDPSQPCATIGRALEHVPYASGNDDGQGVVCFRGTCEEDITVRSGDPQIATRPKRGIEVRDFDYPATPSMLVGWDYDGDQEYPPYDVDDVAELRPPDGVAAAIRLSLGSYNTPTHDIEYAHFVVSVAVGPGIPAQDTALLLSAGGVSSPQERLYFHDLSVRSLMQGRSSSEFPLIDLQMDEYASHSTTFHHLAFENLELLDHGAFVFADHADLELDVSGPIRIANLTTRASACDKSVCADGATASVWHLGGWVEEIEILASVFDANTDAWYPEDGSDPLREPGPTAVVVGECTRDIAILHNELVGWSTAVRVAGNGSFLVEGDEDKTPCDGRDVDVVHVEGNLVRDTSERLVGTTVPFVLQTARVDPDVSSDRTVASVRIVNNVVVADYGLLGCAWMQLWGADAGPIEIAHNTCIGAIQKQTPYSDPALVRVLAPPKGASDPLADLAVRGGLFAGQDAGDVAIATELVPAGWISDHNVFADEAMFRRQTDPATDLVGWQGVSGQDAASLVCTPTFYAVGDFHLADDDVCAADAAVAIAGIAYDIDGEPRADEAWDVGADERP